MFVQNPLQITEEPLWEHGRKIKKNKQNLQVCLKALRNWICGSCFLELSIWDQWRDSPEFNFLGIEPINFDSNSPIVQPLPALPHLTNSWFRGSNKLCLSTVVYHRLPASGRFKLSILLAKGTECVEFGIKLAEAMITIPRHPNTWWAGIWTPKHVLRRFLGVPSTSLPGIRGMLDV